MATNDLLLDTHTLLWVLDGGASLGAECRSRIDRADTVWYSSISVAEIRIKELLGKLTVPPDLLALIQAANLQAASFSVGAADRLSQWPQSVRHDPFDRLLLCHAADLGAHLVTADTAILALEDAPVLDARA